MGAKALWKPHTANLAWIRRKTRPNGNSHAVRSLSLVDLFCGCGGLTLGAWEAARVEGLRLHIGLALDVAQEPIAVYRRNFECPSDVAVEAPIEQVFDGTIAHRHTPSESSWKRRIGQVDLLVAGPPCQGHSDLNNSTRRTDPRNQLYLRVIRATEVLAPSVVVIENVPAVLLDHACVVDVGVRQLRKMGYHVVHHVAQLADLGVPQNRKRHILVASKTGHFDLGRCLRSGRRQTSSVGRFVAGLEDEPVHRTEPFFQPSKMVSANVRRVGYLFENDLHDLPNRLRPPCHRDKSHRYVSMYGRMHWNKPAQTLTSGFGSMGQGRFVHPTRPRTLTAHEAARLQGFPDFFDFSSVTGVTALRAMIGNAVPPQLTSLLVSRLLAEGHLRHCKS